MTQKKYIKVWRFEDAPEKYRKLSTNGGDEDYLALVPKELAGYYYPFLESDKFGICCVDSFTLKNGNHVFIGSHS